MYSNQFLYQPQTLYILVPDSQGYSSPFLSQLDRTATYIVADFKYMLPTRTAVV